MYHIHECFNEIQAIRDHHAGFSGSLNGKVYKLWRNGGREFAVAALQRASSQE